MTPWGLATGKAGLSKQSLGCLAGHAYTHQGERALSPAFHHEASEAISGMPGRGPARSGCQAATRPEFISAVQHFFFRTAS